MTRVDAMIALVRTLTDEERDAVLDALIADLRAHRAAPGARVLPLRSIDTPDDLILTTDDAARYSGQKAGTLRAWRTANPPRGPAFIRIDPRSVRYRRSDLDAWLAANTGEAVIGVPGVSAADPDRG